MIKVTTTDQWQAFEALALYIEEQGPEIVKKEPISMGEAAAILAVYNEVKDFHHDLTS